MPQSRLVLYQNKPNPFNPSTAIGFELPEATHVALRIDDARGSTVRNLVSDRLDGTLYAVERDGRDDRGRDVASRVYYYKLEAGARSISRNLVLPR